MSGTPGSDGGIAVPDRKELVYLAQLSGLGIDDAVLDALINLLAIGAHPKDVKQLLTSLSRKAPSSSAVAPPSAGH